MIKTGIKDSYGREINYMRISITDRCNLRCRYCMPDGAEWIPMKEILTYEEITEVWQEAVKPVSYTHLDVYKRQVFICDCRGKLAWERTDTGQVK